MKFSVIFASLLFAAATLAAANKKYIVSFPAGTPQSEVDKAARQLEAGGARITHRYTLIKGFAVESPEKTIESFQLSTQNAANKPLIEEDQIISIQG